MSEKSSKSSSSKLSANEMDIIKTKEPLFGLMSRKVTGDRVRLALVRVDDAVDDVKG